jgi:hypothetical protein
MTVTRLEGFPSLPVELQLEIWNFCLPSTGPLILKFYKKKHMFKYVGECPVTLFICFQSRQETLKSYRVIVDWIHPDGGYIERISDNPAYFDLSKYTIYITSYVASFLHQHYHRTDALAIEAQKGDETDSDRGSKQLRSEGQDPEVHFLDQFRNQVCFLAFGPEVYYRHHLGNLRFLGKFQKLRRLWVSLSPTRASANSLSPYYATFIQNLNSPLRRDILREWAREFNGSEMGNEIGNEGEDRLREAGVPLPEIYVGPESMIRDEVGLPQKNGRPQFYP